MKDKIILFLVLGNHQNQDIDNVRCRHQNRLRNQRKLDDANNDDLIIQQIFNLFIT